ncbi:MAG: HlyC/CorC family transporter [Lewinellaceae bacterium]|nr:HlyC/CorC family transporter [Lewinella sp.]MCB9277702.1 HlyC/CorC family transporter [Lewinellaceae bacterium]
MSVFTVILVSLLFSALFSGAEIAFISANKLKLELKKKKNAARGRVVTYFFERPAEYLSTMLVGNNVALVIFTTALTVPLNNLLIDQIGLQHEGLNLFVQTLIGTVIVLIFGEFLPKTLFRLYADEILYFLALPLRMIQILLLPFSWLMIRASNGLLKLFFKTASQPVEQTFTRLDLENLVNATGSDSQEEIVDKQLFGNALNLKETRVREAMVPRTEIENIDVSASVAELEQLFMDTKLSRIIVTKDDIDNVLGYVHHQQLLIKPIDIKTLILEIPFVPEAMRVTDLMNKFIKERTSIACVVDEFGGISGLITLEDILEEIFGEIEDEHDEEDYVEVQVSESEYRFSGRLEIDYLNAKYALDLPEGEYHTLSGFLVMTMENIPPQGEAIDLNGYRFILESVSNTKIETVRVIKLSETADK